MRVCIHTCTQVCPYVDIWHMFAYCSSHHFLCSSLQPDWPVSSGIQLPLYPPPPHIQHCSYRCIHHTWLLHRCWSSDLKSSSYLLTKPSGQPSSPSLNSFGVSGYRHILSLSPDDLFFFSLRNCTNEELIYFQAISETCGWVTWSVGSMKSLRESPGKWADPNHQESPSLTMNRDRKLKQLPNSEPWLKENLNLGDWGGGPLEG